MAYFSNGSEGEEYEARYCSKCVHCGECPILVLHSLWNYDALDSETKHTALNVFIPRSKDGLSNEQCRMFVVK